MKKTFPALLASLVISLNTTFAQADTLELESVQPIEASTVAAELQQTDVVPVSAQVEVKEKLSKEQKKEIWVEGTVTDSLGRVWRITFIPGSDRLNHIFVGGWQDAGGYMHDLIEKEFWKEDVIPYVKNVRNVKKSGRNFGKSFVKATWGVLKDMGQDVARYWRNMREQNKELREDKPIGYQAVLVWNGIKFGLKTLWEVGGEWPLETAGRLAFDTVGKHGSIVVWDLTSGPTAATAMVVSRPVAALWNAAGEGALVPGVGYVWNGFSWSLAQRGDVPTKESRPWVVLQHDPVTDTFTLDMKGAETVIESEVLQALMRQEIAVLQARIRELEEKIKALEAERQGEYNKIYEEQRATEAKPAVVAVRELYNQAYQADVRQADADVAALLQDEARLNELVDRIVAQVGGEVTAEERALVLERVRNNIRLLSGIQQ